MSQCPVCESRKGKRGCQYKSGVVCSQCCGTIRQKNFCKGCSFFKEVVITRNYNSVPRYSVDVMESSESLDRYSKVIEGTMCKYDLETKNTIADSVAIRIYELLLDKYYFHEEEILFSNEEIKQGFLMVDEAIQKKIPALDQTMLTKLIGIIWYVAKRRNVGARNYLQVISQYVGFYDEHLGSYIRAIPMK